MWCARGALVLTWVLGTKVWMMLVLLLMLMMRMLLMMMRMMMMLMMRMIMLLLLRVRRIVCWSQQGREEWFKEGCASSLLVSGRVMVMFIAMFMVIVMV